MYMIKKRNFIFLMTSFFLLGTLLPIAAWLINTAAENANMLYRQNYEEEATDNYEKLAYFDRYIRENYYMPIEAGVIETGAYKGQFESLGDIYTVYYTAEEFKKQNESIQGEFFGIGTVLRGEENGFIVVESVLSGSAAEKAGIKAGDFIIAIDGNSFLGKELTEAINILRGEEGAEVNLRIRRGEDEFEKMLQRSKIVTPSVDGMVLKASNLGYIQLTSFANHTAEDFRAKLTEMENANVEGLIIDLRNNAGGLVDKGVEIADMLLDAGTVATAKAGDGSEKRYITEDGSTELPYVVLINESSASTSEILAGAIRDNKGGLLVGTISTGKGIIQKLEQFDDGDGARITIAQYFTPAGHPVQGVGIIPDYLIENIEGDETDLQLEKAIELLEKKTEGAGRSAYVQGAGGFPRLWDACA
ncbi:MAG: S41 family peptidase [Clostridiales Family XIII bacterium]|jgi:carboxyl-terminal processing protease|nr:S41 family peptidase [Clostridiales Family XIII bacterium]